MLERKQQRHRKPDKQQGPTYSTETNTALQINCTSIKKKKKDIANLREGEPGTESRLSSASYSYLDILFQELSFGGSGFV